MYPYTVLYMFFNIYVLLFIDKFTSHYIPHLGYPHSVFSICGPKWSKGVDEFQWLIDPHSVVKVSG